MSAVRADFEGAGGIRLRGSEFHAPNQKARVLIVHGLGEHSGLFDEMALALMERDMSVLSFDLRGHGHSEGTRGHAESIDQMVQDVVCARSRLDATFGTSTPAMMLAHSMGGLITLRYLEGAGDQISAAVLSAPWLSTRVGPGPWLRRAGRLMERIAPGVTLRGKWPPEILTRDPERIAAYHADPLFHQRLSPRLFFSVEEAQAHIMARSEGFGIPVLMVVPDADQLVDPQPTCQMAARLSSQGVELEVLAGFYHQAFQDVGREAVVQRISDWFESALVGRPTSE